MYTKDSALEQSRMADFSTFDLAEIKKDLIIANKECTWRGLIHSGKW